MARRAGVLKRAAQAAADSPTGRNPTRLRAAEDGKPGRRKEYREIAEDTLASFAGIVEHFGLYAGSYGWRWSGCCWTRAVNRCGHRC